MMTRRKFASQIAAISGLSATTGIALTGCTQQQNSRMTSQIWQQWLSSWRRMERIANGRGWTVEPVVVGSKTNPTDLFALAKSHAIGVPPQLEDVVTNYAASLKFSWFIPPHLRPLEKTSTRYPTSSGLYQSVWDIVEIRDSAFPNFFRWKKQLANQPESEAINTPQMWENQFPFASLTNGDMLTIDVTSPDGAKQPVRYFSHDLEGLHGYELASDFIAFITVFSELGCAGTEQDSWFTFIPKTDDKARVAHLSATDDGAKAWFAWLEKDPADHGLDEPPVAIVERTAVDRALLTAARNNKIQQVVKALDNGATIDCVWNYQWLLENVKWGEEFSTALTYAIEHNNREMIELLIARGASPNTRRLALKDAVKSSRLDIVNRLIAKGARVNGWKDQRYWPIHDLVNRGRLTQEDHDSYVTAMTGYGVPRREAVHDAPRIITEGPYVKMLEALLNAGADPDAPWDNGMTMLQWGGMVTARVLLKHGAKVNHVDGHGWTALHRVRTPEHARFLIANGADRKIRDKEGRTAYDLAKPNDTELRAILKPE